MNMDPRIAKTLKLTLSIILPTLVLATVVYAGSLTPPSGTPAATSYTLGDIYTRLTTNATATLANHTVSTSTTPAASFHTLTEIYDAIPTIDATKVLSGTTYLGVAGTASAGSSAAPLKTGQTLCYDPSGNTTNTEACSGSSQDGELLRGVARSYTSNGDGTVTDNSTGLMWKKCTQGLSGTSCGTGSATTMDWATAIASCEADTAGGHSDWHLPNRNELLSIVDITATSPAINTTYFFPTVGTFWANTTYAGSENGAWILYNYGGVDWDGKSFAHYARCVR